MQAHVVGCGEIIAQTEAFGKQKKRIFARKCHFSAISGPFWAEKGRKKAPPGWWRGLKSKQERGSVVVGLVLVDQVTFAVLVIVPIIVRVGAELLRFLVGAQGNIHMKAHELL